MLVGMDIPAAAAGPWIALGVVLGILLLGLAGAGAALLRRGWSADRPAPDDGTDDDPAHDDLAGFLEHPPGTPGERPAPTRGWVTLAAPPPARAPVPAPSPASTPGTGAALTAMAVTGLLLVGAAAAVAASTQDGGAPARSAPTSSSDTGAPQGPGEVEARLSFRGVVLEPHAVGVTATYPRLRITGEPGSRRAEVELPTWNCLAAEAPADPDAAGCRRSRTEYAELAEPDLEVSETDRGIEVSGRFPTVTHPNGSSPAATGRTYELRVTVVPGERPSGGWLPADAVLHLAGGRTESTGTDPAAGVNVLRYGGR